MLRRSTNFFDKTKAPTKIYKHGFMPDPRKFAAMEIPRYSEMFPRTVRPPCSIVPDTDTFLDKTDISEFVPMADFKSAFETWDDLMLSRPQKNRKVRGLSITTSKWLAESIDDYRNGRPPQYYDLKEEAKYFKQFKNGCRAQYRIPELPEKYRPHQLGEDNTNLHKSSAAYREQNKMPAWAIKEEERLQASGFMEKGGKK